MLCHSKRPNRNEETGKLVVEEYCTTFMMASQPHLRAAENSLSPTNGFPDFRFREKRVIIEDSGFLELFQFAFSLAPRTRSTRNERFKILESFGSIFDGVRGPLTPSSPSCQVFLIQDYRIDVVKIWKNTTSLPLANPFR